MKKLLVVSHAMEIGGAERALLGLLESLDREDVAVDLFLYRHTGPWLAMIPRHVRLLPELRPYAALGIPLAEALRRGQWRQALGRLFGKCKAARFGRRHGHPADDFVKVLYSHRYTRWCMPQISREQYDLAISFLTPHYFVWEKVSARRKLAWIHSDYRNRALDIAAELAMWRQYDGIVSISQSVTESFLSVFPSLEASMLLIENIVSPESVRKQAALLDVSGEMPSSPRQTKLLTIGRYSFPKRMDEIPALCAALLARGLAVRWYLIGYGEEEPKIREAIRRHQMEDHVVLLGRKENVYPYINACDVYVQPSRFEGKSIAVREAQILEKPVVVTNFATAASQVNDGYDGVIVPMEIEPCAARLAEVIEDAGLRETLSANCRKTDYGERHGIHTLYGWMV